MFGGIRGPVTTTVRNLITTKEGEEMKQGVCGKNKQTKHPLRLPFPSNQVEAGL